MLTLESTDDLKSYVGKEIGVSVWLLVTQDRISQFAEATEDRQWIHLDGERARRESPFGATVAHGFLTLSLISHLIHQVIQIGSVRLAVNYGLNRVRFVSAVREGSRIRGRFHLISWKHQDGAVDATFAGTIECEGSEKPACVAEWIVRYYK